MAPNTISRIAGKTATARNEVCAAIPDARARRRFAMQGLRTALSAPISMSRMAARARLISSVDLTRDCERVIAPTLVVTGERQLDHVVPVEGSSEYVRRIPNARAVVLERTGHLGTITRPDAFTAIVREFVAGGNEGRPARRPGGDRGLVA